MAFGDPIGVDYGDAIRAMKRGAHAQRAGWNGKGMFVFLVKPNPGNTDCRAYGDQASVALGREVAPYTMLKTADGCIVPWLPSQTDQLAEDWSISEVVS